MDELQASATRESIEKYQLEVARKYEFISNLMGEYPEVCGVTRLMSELQCGDSFVWSQYFSDGVFSFENYRWAHATLDSRAIWWNGERHLVPLLDLINCIEGPDPSRVHSTKLDAAVSATSVR